MNNMSRMQIIGLVVVLILTVLGGVLIVKKSKKHNLVKWVGLFLFLGICLTWVFGYGYYNGTEFSDAGWMYRQGLTDLPYLVYQALKFSLDKIVFLLVLGGFYAVLSTCNGYKKLVSFMAEKLKGKETITIIVASLVFTAMTSVLSQSFVGLVFVPFVISVLLEMKLDKITAFSTTFGAILIGLLGATYGSESLYYFNYYTNISLTTGILYRLIILVVAFVLFNFFTILHAKKVLKENVNEVEADPFKVSKVKEKAKSWPIVVLFALMFVLIILGYMKWENYFGISIFTKFHEWLMNLKIKDFSVFGALFGTFGKTSDYGAFGNWNLFHISTILIVLGVIIALINRVKFNDFITAVGEGVKKMLFPVGMFVGTYMVMAAVYMAGTMPTITNLIMKLSSEFNPFVTALDALIVNTFHPDLGLTGYLVGSYLVSAYAANIEIIHTIFITLYGFVGLVAPTSGILLIGLSYLDIDYKTWLKYIWMFVLGILVILLVLFTVMFYI